MERIQKTIGDRVAAEFSQGRIRETVKAVGAREAERIMYQQLQPALDRVETQAATVSEAFANAQSRVAKLEQDFIERSTPPTLSVQGTHVDVLPDGFRFVATIAPSKLAPIGLVDFRVILAPSRAKIVDVSITGFGGTTGYLDIHRSIDPTGRTAQIAVVPLVEAQFWLNVVVSESTRLVLLSNRKGFARMEYQVAPLP